MAHRYSNLLGVDDGPFPRGHRGDVPIVGTVFAKGRLDGVLVSKVRRDGANSTAQIAAMLRGSPFREHVQAVLIDGIALAGFNVLDLEVLHRSIARPVLVVARKEPDLAAIRSALLSRVRGGARKWRLIQKAGPMESVGGVWVQRQGLSLDEAAQIVRDTQLQGNLPEPLRVAHLIAGALVRGVSRGAA